jgi:hypothetical protein
MANTSLGMFNRAVVLQSLSDERGSRRMDGPAPDTDFTKVGFKQVVNCSAILGEGPKFPEKCQSTKIQADVS